MENDTIQFVAATVMDMATEAEIAAYNGDSDRAVRLLADHLRALAAAVLRLADAAEAA